MKSLRNAIHYSSLERFSIAAAFYWAIYALLNHSFTRSPGLRAGALWLAPSSVPAELVFGFPICLGAAVHMLGLILNRPGLRVVGPMITSMGFFTTTVCVAMSIAGDYGIPSQSILGMFYFIMSFRIAAGCYRPEYFPHCP
jgi:hypothetical protein